MLFWNSKKIKELIRAGKFPANLGRRVFGLEFDLRPQRQTALLHPLSVYSLAISSDEKTPLAYLSGTVVTTRFYRALLDGKATEADFEPWSWESREIPMVFLRHFIVRQRKATPYVFRYFIREMQEVCHHHDAYIHQIFLIASHWVIKRVLHSYYGFEQSGAYRGHPILIGARAKSAALNSLMTHYGEYPRP